MALTIGLTRYDNSRGRTLADLINDPQVAHLFRSAFTTAEDQQKALTKLAKWVNHGAEQWIGQFRKGQNKSFANAAAMLVWLKYKTERTYLGTLRDEKTLAEKINVNAAIRSDVADLIRYYIAGHFASNKGVAEANVLKSTGRYAPFYSKAVFLKRNLGEGLAYFKNQRHPSLSEMAAFLADFGLAARSIIKDNIKYTTGHDRLRFNEAEIHAAVANAMKKLQETEPGRQITENDRKAAEDSIIQPGSKNPAVKRLNYNVAIHHEWTTYMMQKHIPIGAGPSSTTATALGLVDRFFPYGSHYMHFSVAASLFAFWQRKKKSLRGFAAVHTWNEVAAALDNYVPRHSPYAVLVSNDASTVSMQLKVYELPLDINKHGKPIFADHRDA